MSYKKLLSNCGGGGSVSGVVFSDINELVCWLSFIDLSATEGYFDESIDAICESFNLTDQRGVNEGFAKLMDFVDNVKALGEDVLGFDESDINSIDKLVLRLGSCNTYKKRLAGLIKASQGCTVASICRDGPYREGGAVGGGGGVEAVFCTNDKGKLQNVVTEQEGGVRRWEEIDSCYVNNQNKTNPADLVVELSAPDGGEPTLQGISLKAAYSGSCPPTICNLGAILSDKKQRDEIEDTDDAVELWNANEIKKQIAGYQRIIESGMADKYEERWGDLAENMRTNAVPGDYENNTTKHDEAGFAEALELLERTHEFDAKDVLQKKVGGIREYKTQKRWDTKEVGGRTLNKENRSYKRVYAKDAADARDGGWGDVDVAQAEAQVHLLLIEMTEQVTRGMKVNSGRFKWAGGATGVEGLLRMILHCQSGNLDYIFMAAAGEHVHGIDFKNFKADLDTKLINKIDLVDADATVEGDISRSITFKLQYEDGDLLDIVFMIRAKREGQFAHVGDSIKINISIPTETVNKLQIKYPINGAGYEGKAREGEEGKSAGGGGMKPQRGGMKLRSGLVYANEVEKLEKVTGEGLKALRALEDAEARRQGVGGIFDDDQARAEADEEAMTNDELVRADEEREEEQIEMDSMTGGRRKTRRKTRRKKGTRKGKQRKRRKTRKRKRTIKKKKRRCRKSRKI